MDLYNCYAVLENIRAVLSKTEEFSCDIFQYYSYN